MAFKQYFIGTFGSHCMLYYFTAISLNDWYGAWCIYIFVFIYAKFLSCEMLKQKSRTGSVFLILDCPNFVIHYCLQNWEAKINSLCTICKVRSSCYMINIGIGRGERSKSLQKFSDRFHKWIYFVGFTFLSHFNASHFFISVLFPFPKQTEKEKEKEKVQTSVSLW